MTKRIFNFVDIGADIARCWGKSAGSLREAARACTEDEMRLAVLCRLSKQFEAVVAKLDDLGERLERSLFENSDMLQKRAIEELDQLYSIEDLPEISRALSVLIWKLRNDISNGRRDYYFGDQRASTILAHAGKVDGIGPARNRALKTLLRAMDE